MRSKAPKVDTTNTYGRYRAYDKRATKAVLKALEFKRRTAAALRAIGKEPYPIETKDLKL